MGLWSYSLLMHLADLLPLKGKSIAIRGKILSKFAGRCGSNLRLGRGVKVYTPENLAIGSSVYIGHETYVGGGSVTLEDEVIIGPFCCIAAGNHTKKDGSYRFGQYDFGVIRIGRGTWLGAHVTITSGVTIGHGCLVAAGSVVTKSFGNHCKIGGVPAKELGPS